VEGSQLDALRQLAASFRSAIVEARADNAPGALPYFPDGACRLTSRLFALHLTRRPGGDIFGPARLISGVLPGSDFGARHYWLELDDAAVDLTADAFGEPAVVVGAQTAFHHTLTDLVREPVAENLASLSADDRARLARQLVAIEQRMPAFAAPPA
jgi:hypothetical protein